jgi:hypothetical protein
MGPAVVEPVHLAKDVDRSSVYFSPVVGKSVPRCGGRRTAGLEENQKRLRRPTETTRPTGLPA